MSVETISVYLLKESVQEPEQALREDTNTTSVHTIAAGEAIGALFMSEGDEHEPEWVRLLAPAASPPLSGGQHSVSAVLVLPASNRLFAITFGLGGRHMLDRRLYEYDFGLKVALNGLDPDGLRGAQARTFNDYALHTSRQLSRLSDIDALELDVRRDLVIGLEGIVADTAVGSRLAGRDAVRLTAELDVTSLSSKCSELLALSEDTRYEENFPWVGAIEEIRDPDEVEQVQKRAFEALGQRAFAKFDLYPPELLSEEVVEFRHWPGSQSRVIVEPSWDLLNEPIGVPMSADNARDAIERFRLIGIDGDGGEVGRWTYFECLHYETTHEGATFILDGGRWYRIQQSLSDEVNVYVEKLRSSKLKLPKARRSQTEGDYNRMAAEREDLTLVDRKLVYLEGRSSVEPCDLFSADRTLVHIKPRKGGSAPLSHLFAQAVVSAECLSGEPSFRTKFYALLQREAPNRAHLLEEPIRTHDFSIVLGLITDTAGSGRPATELPFFSKLTLKLAVQRLRGMHFNVYVDEIARELAVSPQTPRPRRRRAKLPASTSARVTAGN